MYKSSSNSNSNNTKISKKVTDCIYKWKHTLISTAANIAKHVSVHLGINEWTKTC